MTRKPVSTGTESSKRFSISVGVDLHSLPVNPEALFSEICKGNGFPVGPLGTTVKDFETLDEAMRAGHALLEDMNASGFCIMGWKASYGRSSHLPDEEQRPPIGFLGESG